MGTNASIKLTGLAEMIAQLRQFSQTIEDRSLRKATFAGAKELQRAVIPKVVVRTGLLKSNIVIFRRRRKDTGKLAHAYAVGIKKITRKFGDTANNRRKRRVGRKYTILGPAFYGRFIEFGRSGKRIAPAFLRPGFDEGAPKAIEAVRKSLQKSIKLETKRAAKKKAAT